jgi:chemotaxis-related protein WspD
MKLPAAQSSPNANALDCWKSIGIYGDHSCAELKKHIHCRNCPAFTAGARRLLDREPLPGERATWTRELSEEKSQNLKLDLSLFVFRLGAEWLALPTQVFVEVTEACKPRPLPYRDSELFRGIVNVRGELQLCVSLHRMLKIDAPAQPEKSRRLAVIEKDAARWVFEADAIHGLLRTREADLQPPPATVSKALQPHVRGVLDWDGKQLGCLDDGLLFYQLNGSLE